MADKTINELQQKLDQIIAWFESDDVDIEKVTEQYEKALKLISTIEKQLQETENKITKLNTKFS